MNTETIIESILAVFELREGSSIQLTDSERERLISVIDEIYSDGYKDGQDDLNQKDDDTVSEEVRDEYPDEPMIQILTQMGR